MSCVYRFYNEDHQLLYVGSTTGCDAWLRIHLDHRKKSWWPEVVYVTTDSDWGDDHRDAYRHETLEIRRTNPPYNVINTKRSTHGPRRERNDRMHNKGEPCFDVGCRPCCMMRKARYELEMERRREVRRKAYRAAKAK